MHSTRAFLSSAVGILLLVGLTALPGLLVSPPASAQDVLHEVHAGDDLRLIAGYYYGDTRQWEKIWRANRDVIRNPNRIERGSYLWIPDAKMPTELYAAFLAQARQPAPAAPGVQIPKLEGQAGTPGEVAPGTPAPPPQAAKAPPVSAPPPAKPAEPAKAAPAPAGPPPAKAAPPAGPEKPAEPAKAAAPPAKADVAKAPQPAAPPAALQAMAAPAGAPAPPPPAAQAAKAPAPPAKRPLPPPPPPPKEWYEELLSPEIFTSFEFLAGVGVLLLALVGLLLWRRRSAAKGEE